jgi:GT2 family glycosyltransferase
VVVFTEDDMFAAPTWFGTLVRAICDAGQRCVVTGRVRPAEQRSGYFVSVTRGDELPVAYEGRISKDVLTTGNMAMYRTVVEDVGDFDERLGAGSRFPSAEDNDFGFRLLEAGYRIVYVPEAVLYHRAWRSNREIVPLRWRYGVGQGAFYAKHLSLRDRYMLSRILADFRYYTFRVPRFLRHDRSVALRGLIFLLGVVYGALAWLLTQRKAP